MRNLLGGGWNGWRGRWRGLIAIRGGDSQFTYFVGGRGSGGWRGEAEEEIRLGCSGWETGLRICVCGYDGFALYDMNMMLYDMI